MKKVCKTIKQKLYKRDRNELQSVCESGKKGH